MVVLVVAVADASFFSSVLVVLKPNEFEVAAVESFLSSDLVVPKLKPDAAGALLASADFAASPPTEEAPAVGASVLTSAAAGVGCPKVNVPVVGFDVAGAGVPKLNAVAAACAGFVLSVAADVAVGVPRVVVPLAGFICPKLNPPLAG